MVETSEDATWLSSVTEVFAWSPRGVNRLQYTGSARLSDVFDKDSVPAVGAIGVAYRGFDDQVDETAIVGLGVVRSVVGVANGAVRAMIAPLYLLTNPVALTELGSEGLTVDLPAHFYADLLDQQSGHALLSRLAKGDPGVVDWVARVTGAPPEYAVQVQQARVETKDAVGLAASLADFDLPEDAFAAGPLAHTEDTLLNTVINTAYQFDLEEELLPLDLQRFDGKLSLKQSAASMGVFVDKKDQVKLVVMSLNKKPLEVTLGVDLLYWDQTHDSFTFVQYKRLELSKPSDPEAPPQWAYRKRKEIQGQLDLMPTSARVGSSEDWRMTDTPFWFKFVRGDAGAKLDNQVLKGMYVPADWLRLAINDGALNTGPKGGFRVSYEGPTKYVGRGSFVQLVARGFVGTTQAQSADFKPILESLGRNRELIVAVKAKWTPNTPSVVPRSVVDGELPF